MPIYPVINKETGEKKELSMTMLKYDEWRKANPDWDRDWSEGCASAQEVGEFTDKLIQKHPGWNDVLRSASKQPGATVRPY